MHPPRLGAAGTAGSTPTRSAMPSARLWLHLLCPPWSCPKVSLLWCSTQAYLFSYVYSNAKYRHSILTVDVKAQCLCLEN